MGELASLGDSSSYLVSIVVSEIFYNKWITHKTNIICYRKDGANGHCTELKKTVILKKNKQSKLSGRDRIN